MGDVLSWKLQDRTTSFRKSFTCQGFSYWLGAMEPALFAQIDALEKFLIQQEVWKPSTVEMKV